MKITERPARLWRRTTSSTRLGEVGRQRRRHLVEQQDVGLDGERAREIEDAQHGERHVAGESRGGRGRARRARAPSRRNGATGVRGQAEVGGDVEVGDQRRLLVDRHQPGAPGLGRRVHVARLAADQDAAGVRADRAGQDLDQRRLAGAVRAHQRVHLAGHAPTATRCAAPPPRRSSWRRRWRRGAAVWSCAVSSRCWIGSISATSWSSSIALDARIAVPLARHRASIAARMTGDGRRPFGSTPPLSIRLPSIIRPGPCRRRSGPWCRWSSPGSR